MRKKLATFLLAGVLAGGLVGTNLSTAQATDPYLKLQRQINVLKAKVADLQHEVWTCEFVDAEPTLFDDGSYGYAVYDEAACVN
jgi:hypothetical protein